MQDNGNFELPKPRRIASSGLRVPKLSFSSRFPTSARRSSGTRFRSQ